MAVDGIRFSNLRKLQRRRNTWRNEVLAHHRLIHEALEFAVIWQVIGINPAKAATPPRPEKKEVNVLTREEIHKLLEGAKTKYFMKQSSSQ